MHKCHTIQNVILDVSLAIDRFHFCCYGDFNALTVLLAYMRQVGRWQRTEGPGELVL